MEQLEYYGYVRSLTSLDRADIALITIDSVLGITEGDQKIIGMALSRGCAIILLANKWDLLRGDEDAQIAFEQSLERRLRYIHFAPILKISAKNGLGLKGIYKLIDEVYEEHTKHIKTSALNKFVAELKLKGKIAQASGKLKVYYCTQVKTAPPHLVFHVNDVRYISMNVRAYFERLVRDKFGFVGTPLYISFRKSK